MQNILIPLFLALSLTVNAETITGLVTYQGLDMSRKDFDVDKFCLNEEKRAL